MLLALAGPASALALPRLFEPLAPYRAFSAHVAGTGAVATAALPKNVLFMQRVNMRTDAFGTDMSVSIDGQERVLQFVTSDRERADGETYVYSAGKDSQGKDEANSVVTSFYDTRVPKFATIVIDRKWYFVSPEGSHYVVTLMAGHETRDEVVTAEEMLAQMPFGKRLALFAHGQVQAQALAATALRRRACCDMRTKVYAATSVDDSYLNVIGDKDGLSAEDRARARIVHSFDRGNLAYLNSGAGDIYVVNREIAFGVNAPQGMLPGKAMIAWAQEHDSPVNQVRRRNHAGVSLFVQQGSGIAFMASPDPAVPVIPDWQVATNGGYFADWDDGDMWGMEHELFGHTVAGVDHDPKAAMTPLDGPFGFRHSACLCDVRVQFVTAYNSCETSLTRTELFPGPKAKELYPELDLSVSDAVKTIHLVAPRSAGNFDN